MYIEKLELGNIRTFKRATLDFVHPDRIWSKQVAANGGPKPRLPNVNLLLGDNGSGKTTVLQTVALSTFGPTARDANLAARTLVRQEQVQRESRGKATSRLFAHLRLHEQDRSSRGEIDSEIHIHRRGELEHLRFESREDRDEDPTWGSVYESENDAFFVVGYGATRRVEPGENLDMGARSKSRFLRAQRVQSLFQDSFSLIPLTFWLPKLKSSNPGRYKQVIGLIATLLKPGKFEFTGELGDNDYVFRRSGVNIPFQSLSDGYRAFIGWVGDLLYHVCYGCPKGKKLVKSSGVVLVDEIDLHLHPKWQMEVINAVATTLPRLQFIMTSHSPLVAGSLESMNIHTLKLTQANTTKVGRLTDGIHGLDADQILLTDLFGLKTTRARTKTTKLKALTKKARAGDNEAARQLVAQLASGAEDLG